MNQTSATGYIRVRVTNGGGNFPVEGATVYIVDYNDDAGALLYTLRTNSGGQTRTASVPTVPIAESLAPGAEKPYSMYNIRVVMKGYYTAESVGVPVFEGIVSLQNFNLQPLSETDLQNGGSRIVYEVADAPGDREAGYPGEAPGERESDGNGGNADE